MGCQYGGGLDNNDPACNACVYDIGCYGNFVSVQLYQQLGTRERERERERPGSEECGKTGKEVVHLHTLCAYLVKG